MVTLASWETGPLPTDTVGASLSIGSGAGIFTEHVAINHNGSGATYIELPFTASETVALRYYIETPSSWPTSSHAICTFRDGAFDNVGRFPSLAGQSTPGSVRLVDNAGSQLANAPSSTLSLATVYRIEAQVDHANSRGRLAVFPETGTTSIWDSGWQTGTFRSQTDAIQIGATAGASPQVPPFKIAQILVTDDISTYIGEAEVIAPGNQMKVYIWDGTTLVPIIGVV